VNAPELPTIGVASRGASPADARCPSPRCLCRPWSSVSVSYPHRPARATSRPLAGLRPGELDASPSWGFEPGRGTRSGADGASALFHPDHVEQDVRPCGVGVHRGFEYSASGNPTRARAGGLRRPQLEAPRHGPAFRQADSAAEDTSLTPARARRPQSLPGIDLYGGALSGCSPSAPRPFAWTSVDLATSTSSLRLAPDNPPSGWRRRPTPLLRSSNSRRSPLAHARGHSCVDNTFSTPFLQRLSLWRGSYNRPSTRRRIVLGATATGRRVSSPSTIDDLAARLRFSRTLAARCPPVPTANTRAARREDLRCGWSGPSTSARAVVALLLSTPHQRVLYPQPPTTPPRAAASRSRLRGLHFTCAPGTRPRCTGGRAPSLRPRRVVSARSRALSAPSPRADDHASWAAPAGVPYNLLRLISAYASAADLAPTSTSARLTDPGRRTHEPITDPTDTDPDPADAPPRTTRVKIVGRFRAKFGEFGSSNSVPGVRATIVRKLTVWSTRRLSRPGQAGRPHFSVVAHSQARRHPSATRVESSSPRHQAQTGHPELADRHTEAEPSRAPHRRRRRRPSSSATRAARRRA